MMIGRTLSIAGIALAALATLACQRPPEDAHQPDDPSQPGDLRGTLHDMLDDIEQIARDEIEILEDLLGQPDRPILQSVWRRRLDEAISALERLAALRAEVDASADADLAGAVGQRVTSVVEEIRNAIDERMQRLRAELAGPRVA